MLELRHIALKLLWRLLLVAALVIGFNQLYSAYFWEDDLDIHAPMLPNLLAMQDTCDVLYFGESSNFTTASVDTNKASISEMINAGTDLNVGTINHGAYHAGMYLPLIKQITSERVKTIIVTLNLRTFGQDVIHGGSESHLQKAARFYEPQPPLLNRTLAALSFYDDKSSHERDQLKWHDWTYDTLKSSVDSISFPTNTIRRWCEVVKFPDSNGIEDMTKRPLADHYVKVYGFRIQEGNPMLLWMDEIHSYCLENGYRLIFNLMAENTQDAEAYIGKNLVWLMGVNRSMLVRRYERFGATVVDNLEAIDAEHFVDRATFPTEHYDQIGRQIIANNVLKALNTSK